MSLRIVDTFAGPGGWDEGMRMLGLADPTAAIDRYYAEALGGAA